MKLNAMTAHRRDGNILLAVDLSYQVYRAAAAHPLLTSRRVFTGGLYGFLTTFAKMMRETRATHVAICSDRKPYVRSKTYPEYKKLRKARADDELLKMFNQSMTLVTQVLQDCGLTIWGVPGFESDDLVAHCVKQYRHRFEHIYAASNDSDLYQLLTAPNFSIYTKDLLGAITAATLMKKQGMTPAQFMLTTALTGTHNDVAGIDKVGPVTAKKAVFDPAVMRTMRAKHADIIDRNLAIIKLPHAEFPVTTRLPVYVGGFDKRKFYQALSQYDIDPTQSMVSAFEQLTRSQS